MKILYLCHRIPYPPNKGDKIRSFNEIKHLSTNHEVHLACLADNPAELRYGNDLRTYCKAVHVVSLNKIKAKLRSILSLVNKESLSVGYFYSSALQNTVNQWLTSNSYGAIICFSSPMAEYLFRSPFFASRFSTRLQYTTRNLQPATPKLIMDFVDLDSDKWLQYSHTMCLPLKPVYRIEHKRLFAYERKSNQSFDHSIFVSDHETNLFDQLCRNATNLVTIPNGVDHDFFSSKQVTQTQHDQLMARHPESKHGTPILLFTGAMDYYANVDGVLWFFHEIFPRIKQHIPEAVFFIVGSRPDQRINALGKRKDVVVTGFVKDIRPYYERADVCVTPLRLGRGVQNKVLEAMAMETPVVAAPKAIEGIRTISGKHLFVESTPQGFSDAVSTLLKDKELRKHLGTNARDFIVSSYDWSTHMRKLDTLLHMG